MVVDRKKISSCIFFKRTKVRQTEVASRNTDEVLVHWMMVVVEKEEPHLHVDKMTTMTTTRERFETTTFWTNSTEIGMFRVVVVMTRMTLEVVDLYDQRQPRVHENIKKVVIIIDHHLQHVIVSFL